MRTPAIPKQRWQRTKQLYESGLAMREVGARLGVSIDAVTYVLRRLGVPRRSFVEANHLAYERRSPSFSIRKRAKNRELELMGTMLYWAEGYKRETASGIDFANSDPDMVLLFWHFLRNRYVLDRARLYFSVYHYSDQNLKALVRFWSLKLGVPRTAFKHSYVKQDPQRGARKLRYGVLHIRYNDKKLLRDVLHLIESHKRK